MSHRRKISRPAFDCVHVNYYCGREKSRTNLLNPKNETTGINGLSQEVSASCGSPPIIAIWLQKFMFEKELKIA